MSIQLSHFSAAIIFSIFASIVFGITQRPNPRDMVLYGAKCFAFFVAGTVIASWVMWVIKH